MVARSRMLRLMILNSIRQRASAQHCSTRNCSANFLEEYTKSIKSMLGEALQLDATDEEGIDINGLLAAVGQHHEELPNIRDVNAERVDKGNQLVSWRWSLNSSKLITPDWSVSISWYRFVSFELYSSLLLEGVLNHIFAVLVSVDPRGFRRRDS